MFGYATHLRSGTQGRGVYTMQFDHYEEVPKGIAEEILDYLGYGNRYSFVHMLNDVKELAFIDKKSRIIGKKFYFCLIKRLRWINLQPQNDRF